MIEWSNQGVILLLLGQTQSANRMKLYRKMAKCVISIVSSIYFIAEIDLGKDDDILQVFMDPTGDHVIIAMRSETNYYLHRLAKSVKQLSKFHVSSTCKYKYVCILYLHI